MNANFAYHHEQTAGFEKEFFDMVDSYVPFFAISESLIALMKKNNVTFFDIPAHKTFAKKWLRFHFTIRMEGTTELYYYDRVEKFDKNPKTFKEN